MTKVFVEQPLTSLGLNIIRSYVQEKSLQLYFLVVIVIVRQKKHTYCFSSVEETSANFYDTYL